MLLGCPEGTLGWDFGWDLGGALIVALTHGLAGIRRHHREAVKKFEKREISPCVTH